MVPRPAFAELGRILIYEAVRDWLPTVDLQVQTPLGSADATVVDPMQPIKVGFQEPSPSSLLWSIELPDATALQHRWAWLTHRAGHCCPPLPPQVVPILRAGLLLLEQAATLLPVTQTYHVGYMRSDETLEVSEASWVYRALISRFTRPQHLRMFQSCSWRVG